MNLTDYIAACRRRLQRRIAARRALAVAAGLLLLTLIAAWSFVTLVPPTEFVISARIVVFAILILGVLGLVLWRTDNVVPQIEARVPAFQGRLQTWSDATERGEQSAMLKLLDQQTATMAETYPENGVVRTREIAVPVILSVVGAIALVVFVATGTNPWQLAAKRLWTGDLFTATVPRIVVAPGDTVVPRGRNVVIEAQALGFNPQQMRVHAMFQNGGAWEQAGMTRVADDKYGFVFVGVSEEVEYYVGSKGLNSQRHVIRVADLPRITDVALTYEYPSWTGVEPREILDGDISAVAGTNVDISATADAPVDDAFIVVNGKELPAVAAGTLLTSAFAVEEEGTWHVAVRHEGIAAQISDSYVINTVPDKPPEVAFTWPGHDRQATPIEEVGFRFSANDDFVLESLMMSYSVNGGEWREVQLDVQDPQHTLYLEDLTIDDDDNRALTPGDMISFYAEAKDHTQSTKTSLFFVDVRPFDKVYRERQSSGGGGGGGDQDGGFEIAQRQREIVTATWNLINKKDNGEGEQALSDQAETLALLQRTLKDQVETLTARADARMLTRDEEIDQFTAELLEAATFMEPAAEKLAAEQLREAIKPEQQALQHLLAAEATMTDVDVSMGQNQGRGTSGRSLSELVDLEMDRERNRYETQQNTSAAEDGAEDDGDWRKLEELARRQEQLNERQTSGQDSLASRWQQERLQRELEKLEEQLQRQRENQQGRGTQSQALENAIADLNQAREAIDRSIQESQSSPSPSQQSSGGNQSQSSGSPEAATAMRNAAQALRENERNKVNERLAETTEQVENLIADQQNAMERLAEVQEESLEAARRGEGNPFRNFAMEPYADRKRRMQEQLSEITEDLNDVRDSLAGRDPQTQRSIERAIQELQDENVDDRLSESAAAFEIGRPLFAIDNEEVVARALERFGRRLGQAQRQLSEGGAGAQNQSSLAQVRELRRALNGSRAGGGTNVEIDRGELNSLRRATEHLEQELLGANTLPDMRDSRDNYVPRGADDANDENLADLLRDRLDLIEASLLNADRAPIQAQRPRDSERDSNVAAEYFKELSAAEHER